MKTPEYHGLLVLDKPGGMTSRDTVNRVQEWFPRRTRIGHTGTLDPLATGVLVLCVGTATRLTEYVQRMGKTYRAGLTLGARSDTDDADGKITPVAVDRPPDRAAIEQCLQGFLGEIEQVPPAYSAAKVTGRRAYDLARAGEDVSLQARRVRIDAIDVLSYDYPHLEVEVHCGKGTYIRSLARDLGERLGCGALVQTLRRTRVGPFDAASALKIESNATRAHAHLLPVSTAVAELPRVTLPPTQLAQLCQGRAVPFEECRDRTALGEAGDEIAVFDQEGTLIALAAADRVHQVLRPRKVLPERHPGSYR